jgi:hypothetical protein
MKLDEVGEDDQIDGEDDSLDEDEDGFGVGVELGEIYKDEDGELDIAGDELKGEYEVGIEVEGDETIDEDGEIIEIGAVDELENLAVHEVDL